MNMKITVFFVRFYQCYVSLSTLVKLIIYIWKKVFCMLFFGCCGKKAGQKSSLEEISDSKEFKKLLKTRTSVLVCYTKSLKESSNVIKKLAEVSDAVRGTGTIVTVDCGG